MLQQPLRLHIGDVLQLRKDHPCGSFEFEVVRLGADIGLRCVLCNRRILLARNLLERRLVRFVTRQQEAAIDLSEFGEPAVPDAPVVLDVPASPDASSLDAPAPETADDPATPRPNP